MTENFFGWSAFHDATLDAVELGWTRGTLVLHVRTSFVHATRCAVVVHGPARGADGTFVVEVEMQSGDVIHIEAETFEVLDEERTGSPVAYAQFLSRRVVSVERAGVQPLTLHRDHATTAVTLVEAAHTPVVGCTVVIDRGGVFESRGVAWTVRPKGHETHAQFVARSAEECTRFIADYPGVDDGIPLFGLQVGATPAILASTSDLAPLTAMLACIDAVRRDTLAAPAASQQLGRYRERLAAVHEPAWNAAFDSALDTLAAGDVMMGLDRLDPVIRARLPRVVIESRPE